MRLDLFICLIFLFFAACERKETLRLDVQQILDKSGDTIKARLGEPEIDFTRSQKVTTLQWRDIDGDSTWVYIDLIYDRASYVTYTFKKMDPFDMEEALRRVGLTLPEDEPERTWKNGSMRWKPFDPYHRLVINPVIKSVTVSLDFDEVLERETAEE